MILFTYLKIILLQYFQFSAKINCIQIDPKGVSNARPSKIELRPVNPKENTYPNSSKNVFESTYPKATWVDPLLKHFFEEKMYQIAK